MSAAATQLSSNYILDERLGSGAMGTVHAAHLAGDDQRVAIKLLHPHLLDNEVVVARFHRECLALTRIDHDNVVRVIDMVAEGDRLGIVMEHVDGGDLRSMIGRAHSSFDPIPVLDPVAALRLAADIAAGLEVVHQAGIIHRDLKPANILLDRSGSRLVPKISDFGVARVDADHMGAPTAAVGTPLFMAPEVGQGLAEVGPAADIYSLGVILFELLIGRPPFDGTGPEVIRLHVIQRAPKIVNVSDDLSNLVASMLDKDPSARPTAPEVRCLLDELVAHPASQTGAMVAAPDPDDLVVKGQWWSSQPADPDEDDDDGRGATTRAGGRWGSTLSSMAAVPGLERLLAAVAPSTRPSRARRAALAGLALIAALGFLLMLVMVWRMLVPPANEAINLGSVSVETLDSSVGTTEGETGSDSLAPQGGWAGDAEGGDGG